MVVSFYPKGSFWRLSKERRDVVMWLVAQYHRRDGTKHSDGMLGTIEITPMAFSDLLACLLFPGDIRGHQKHRGEYE